MKNKSTTKCLQAHRNSTRNLHQQTTHITLTSYYKGEVKALLQLQKLLNRYKNIYIYKNLMNKKERLTSKSMQICTQAVRLNFGLGNHNWFEYDLFNKVVALTLVQVTIAVMTSNSMSVQNLTETVTLNFREGNCNWHEHVMQKLY